MADIFIVPKAFLLGAIVLTTSGFSYSSENEGVFFVGRFSVDGLNQWDSIEFDGKTEYLLHADAVNGQAKGDIVRAKSVSSASGLVRKITVNIKEYPYLNWRWRVNKSLDSLEEYEQEGDDYAARVYIMVSDGWFFWQTKALNYVWSSRAQTPKSWPNAFAPDNTLMIPMRNSLDASGQWFAEKRNIGEDLKAWLGKSFDEIEAVAIMTDTDNSGLAAEADYGDIYFSRQ